MSKKDQDSSTNAGRQTKRLARAKIKAPEPEEGGGRRKDGSQRQEGAKGRAKPKLTAAEAKERRKKRATTIIIVAFAILMALSMMLPSFSAIFANRNAQQAAEEQQQDDSSSSDGSSSDDSSSDDSSDGSTQADTGTVAGIDSEYQDTVQSLEAKLADDPQNLATLLGLGNDYMNWGYQVARIASTDDETSHAGELLEKAEGYYDQYLALNDSPMVRTNRALCQFYAGDTSGATAALEELTQSNPDFGLAWANLGLMYEVAGSTDQAKEAYGKAEEADPDDEYGAKTFAETRLASIEASESSASSSSATDSSTSATTSATGAEALSDALGTGL